MVTAGAVVLLLGGIALGASAGSSNTSNSGADPRWLADLVLSMTAALVVVGSTALIFGWLGYLKPRHDRGAKDLVARIITAVVFVVGAFVYLGVLFWGSKRDHKPPPLAQQLPAQQAPKATKPVEPAAKPDWSLVAGVGVLVAVGVIGVVMWPRLRPVQLESHDVDAEPVSTLVEALDESLDALFAETDDRLAVIAAYRRMELLLRRSGLGRQPWEAPFEHLQRVLVELGGSASTASRLTELFERARFSPHPVGPDMRQEAVDALMALRGELSADPVGATRA